MTADEPLSPEELKFMQSLYLILVYLHGRENHNEYLANPYPARINSPAWKSKETFVNLRCPVWIGLDFDILDQLEEAGFLKQPQKGTKEKRTYVELNKNGMKYAREILKEINLDGVKKEVLEAKSPYEEYANYITRIDLMAEESKCEEDTDFVGNEDLD